LKVYNDELVCKRRFWGNYAQAIELQKQSLAVTQTIGDLNGEVISLSNIGFSYYKLGNLTEANKHLRQGIQVMESIWKKLVTNDSYKLSVFEEQAKTYQLLQLVLVADDKINEALEISELGRARALAELVSNRLMPLLELTVQPPHGVIPSLVRLCLVLRYPKDCEYRSTN
jgi:tetratricopeptide (TPR) repeat protein